jgi:hypothetical protein
VKVEFVLCNRDPGESRDTDDSVEAIRAGFDVPVTQVSAIGFRKDERRAARRAEEAGDAGPLQAWRDAFYASYRDRLPSTDLDLLVGDMWIWGPAQCAERRGLNLHPALPGGPAGVMWYDVIWDLVADGAAESGAMLHLVTPEVDLGPVVSYTRYGLRTTALEALWGSMPADHAALADLVAAERALKRECRHPLFGAIRKEGVLREGPLLLSTLGATAAGTLRIGPDGAEDSEGVWLAGGLDLTAEVEALVDGF